MEAELLSWVASHSANVPNEVATDYAHHAVIGHFPLSIIHISSAAAVFWLR